MRVAVNRIDVSVGGMGVDVGGSDVVAGALHPPKNRMASRRLIAPCDNFWQFILASFLLELPLLVAKRANDRLQVREKAGATELDVWQPIFSPAFSRHLQAIVRTTVFSNNYVISKHKFT